MVSFFGFFFLGIFLTFLFSGSGVFYLFLVCRRLNVFVLRGFYMGEVGVPTI